jgi:hypothetical protein
MSDARDDYSVKQEHGDLRTPPGDDLQPIELSIVMPCLNEARTLGICIRKAQGFMARNGIIGEVVIGDNGSTDGSKTIAYGLGARVIEVETRGYGAALMAAIRAARGTYVIMADSDDSYDFERLEGFVAELRAGHDLVMGNRFRGGIAPGAMPPLHKFLGNPVLTGIGRLFFRSPCRDFHCGLRGFRRTAILDLDLQTPGMEFASEMVVKATLNGLRVTEVPTTLSKDGRDRAPHLRSFRDGWRHLRFLLLFCPRWLFLVPGAAILFASLGLIAALLPGPLHLGALELDVHSLVVANAGAVFGAQLILFFLLAKQFAADEGLIPGGRRFDRVRRAITLEGALVAGGALLALGIGGIAAAAMHWSAIGFGELDYQTTMRLVVPSTGAMTLGLEVLFLGFLSSLLDLRRS